MKRGLRKAALLILVAGLASGCAASATPSAPAPSLVPPVGAPTEIAPYPAPSLVAPSTGVPVPSGTPSAPVQPQGGSTLPVPTGGPMRRGSIILEGKGVAYDATKKQVILNLSGNLPTPCHKLQTEVPAPDAQNRIQVSVYTLANPSMMCAQVLKPFEAAVPLGDLASGTYTVFVNGDQVGEVKVP